jgi:hypothetical protein
MQRMEVAEVGSSHGLDNRSYLDGEIVRCYQLSPYLESSHNGIAPVC